MVGAARGYKVVLDDARDDEQGAPRAAARLRRRARAHRPARSGMKGAVAKAEEIVAEREGAVLARQFANEANPEIHRRRPPRRSGTTPTAPSTSSSPASAPAARSPASARCSRSASPSVQIIAVEPEESPILNGGTPGPHKIQGIGANFVPEILDTDVYDEVIDVNAATPSSGPAAPPPRRACSSASPPGPRSRPRPGRRAPGERRQDDRRHHPELRRALPVDDPVRGSRRLTMA